MHAGRMEPIFEAVLANDPSRITAIEAGTPGAAKLRMYEDLLVTELPHQLYRGDTPLHLAAAGLRYDAARALLAAGSPVNAVKPRGATLLVSAGATVDPPDRGGVTPRPRAARARSPAAVAALLSAGADPRAATSKAGSTPPHL